MSRPEAKGWCPGAYQPMMSGDGLVVRVRPVLARLSRSQSLGLCDIARELGSGIIDLTSRANLQIRGVAEKDHETVLKKLSALDLLPDDPALESRRNILIPPLWADNDDAVAIAKQLMECLGDLPELPPKMGYAIDVDGAPQFGTQSADFRFERTADGALLLRADGASRGRSITRETAIDALLEMAEWFIKTDGPAHRRMASHVDFVALPADWQAVLPASPMSKPSPGETEIGTMFGVPFGQIHANDLHQLMSATSARALRVTPWRLLLLEGVGAFESSRFITTPDDPLLMIDACPGMPLCNSATVETRKIARALASKVNGALHVSGCAKGCARPQPCTTTLVGNNGTFDLVKNGRPWDAPIKTGLTPETLKQAWGDL